MFIFLMRLTNACSYRPFSEQGAFVTVSMI